MWEKEFLTPNNVVFVTHMVYMRLHVFITNIIKIIQNIENYNELLHIKYCVTKLQLLTN